MAFFQTIIKSISSRSKNVIKNILLSVGVKAVNVLCSLILVPLSLGYLSKEEYGIWLTISTMLLWISFFDIGLGNGLRNYLSEAISKGDYVLGRTYISTTLALLLIIVGAFALLCCFSFPFLDWANVLNTDAIGSDQLMLIMLITVLLTLMNFVLKNVGVVYIALQRYAMNELLHMFGNVLSLFVIFVITQTLESSLMWVVISFSASPLLVFIVAAFPLFKKYKELRPSLKSVDFAYSKMLMSKGGAFFGIQMTTVFVIYASSNFFITQCCGPEAVGIYNTAYRYLSISTMGFTTLIAPLWNAYTDAYVKNDMGWIKKTFWLSLKMWGITACIGLLMLLVSPWVYGIWIGDALDIPFSVSFSIFVYFCFLNLSNCASYLLNGLNIIYVQLLSSIFVTILYLLIVFPMGRYFYIEGVSWSMTLSFVILSLIRFYQVKKVFNGTASGCWLK